MLLAGAVLGGVELCQRFASGDWLRPTAINLSWFPVGFDANFDVSRHFYSSIRVALAVFCVSFSALKLWRSAARGKVKRLDTSGNELTK